VPCLGVYPAADGALTEAQMAASGSYADAGWRYARLEGSGHWPQRDAPGELAALLLGFLAEGGGGGARGGSKGSGSSRNSGIAAPDRPHSRL
jgi:hypothetical protein